MKMNKIIKTDDVKDYKSLTQQLLAEFIGTFLYLTIALLGSNDIKGYSIVCEALANGLIIAAIIYIFGPLSGAHINPAVTVGVLVNGYISLWKALLYIVAQICGGLVGATVAYGLTADTQYARDLGATIPHEMLNTGRVFGFECLLTFLLVLTILTLAYPRYGYFKKSGCLVVGFCVVGCQCACLGYSASMNPVRALGPAIIMNVWNEHAMYWIGPLIGGLAAGLVYRFLLCEWRRTLVNNENA